MHSQRINRNGISRSNRSRTSPLLRISQGSPAEGHVCRMKTSQAIISALLWPVLCLAQLNEPSEAKRLSGRAPSRLARDRLTEALDAVMPMGGGIAVYRQVGCELEIVPERYFAIKQDQDGRLSAVLIRPANHSVYLDLVKGYEKNGSLHSEEAIASVSVEKQRFTEQEVPTLREWYNELTKMSFRVKPEDMVPLDGPEIRLRFRHDLHDIAIHTWHTRLPLVRWAQKVHRQLQRVASRREAKHNE